MQQGSGGFQLWVGNAPFDATEEELKSVLSLGSKVLNVRVKYDSESGAPLLASRAPLRSTSRKLISGKSCFLALLGVRLRTV